MKKVILIFALFIILPFYSQNSWNKETIKGNGNISKQERKTETYDGIEVSGSFKVILVSGKEGNISIQGDQNLLEYVVVEVKEATLEIKFKKGGNYSVSKKIEVTVPVEEISSVALSGSGSITTQTELKSSNFNVAQSGSGTINLKLDSDTLKAKLSGSGHINLNGTTNNLHTALSGSGNINSENLISQNSECAVSGSGSISVNTKNSLKASVSGSGNIKYVDEPQKINEIVSGSGKIYKI